MHVRRKFSPLVESSRIKVGHVIFAINRTKVLHSLYGFGIVTRSIVLTNSLKFLWSAVVKGAVLLSDDTTFWRHAFVHNFYGRKGLRTPITISCFNNNFL